MNGKFISIDGMDGAGKTTQIQKIHEYLSSKNIDVWISKEPGGTKIGEEIRRIFLSPEFNPSAFCELFLIFAARFQHLEEEILPRLKQGQWVICDRFNDSTYAYQCANGINPEQIKLIEQNFPILRNPDLSIIMMVDVDIAIQRRNCRINKDRIENKNREFVEKIRNLYLQRLENPHAKLVNANGNIEESFEQIRKYLDEII